MTDAQKRTIDERLEALAMNMELLEARVDKMAESIGRTNENTARLAQIVEVHEQDRQRFFRAMRAALEAWFDGEDDDK